MNLFDQRARPVVVAICLALLASVAAGAADPTRVAPDAVLPTYRSAFSNYKPLNEDKPDDWRALNDAVQGEGMAGMGTSAHDMPGMRKMPEHEMPMPASKGRAPVGLAKAHSSAAQASTPSMKGMPGMPGMPNRSNRDRSGGKP